LKLDDPRPLPAAHVARPTFWSAFEGRCVDSTTLSTHVSLEQIGRAAGGAARNILGALEHRHGEECGRIELTRESCDYGALEKAGSDVVEVDNLALPAVSFRQTREEERAPFVGIACDRLLAASAVREAHPALFQPFRRRPRVWPTAVGLARVWTVALASILARVR
jgi:hypothetical protein